MARLTPAVMRALDILELFVDGARSSVADIMRRTGLPRTTVFELVNTLAARGYLERDELGGYILGARTLTLGNAYASRYDLVGEAADAARQLAQSTGETSSVAILEGNEVFYLAKVEGREVLALISSVGKRAPANATGLGKALLAYLEPDQVDALWPDGVLPALTGNTITDLSALRADLDATRERGFALEREESGPGVACVAAPVLDVSGRVPAAVSISVPLARWDQYPLSHWSAVVLQAAAAMSERVGYVPLSTGTQVS